MSDFFEEQAKRLYGLGDMEREAIEVLRLIVQRTELGRNLDAELFERGKAIVEQYDRVMMRGHDAPGVVPFPSTIVPNLDLPALVSKLPPRGKPDK